MLERISAREFEEWMIFERLESDDEREAYENAQKNVEPTEPAE